MTYSFNHTNQKRFLGGVLREKLLYENAIENGQKSSFFLKKNIFFLFKMHIYFRIDRLIYSELMQTKNRSLSFNLH